MLHHNSITTHFTTAVLLAIAILLCATALHADSTTLNNMSGLAELEDMCVKNSTPDQTYDNPAKQIADEFTLLKNELAKTHIADRPAKLRELADRTKWGTPERAAAYYVCAWFGVNYEHCRDYMLNSVFWYERGYHKKSKVDPYDWQEMGFDLLFKLYEHNLDFDLLHDLMLGTSDGAGAEVLTGCKIDAFWKHPRGVLHVAEISLKGHEYVVRALQKRTGNLNLDSWFDDEKEKGLVFADYVSRVAADTKDPLQPLAKGLLRDAKRMKWDAHRTGKAIGAALQPS